MPDSRAKPIENQKGTIATTLLRVESHTRSSKRLFLKKKKKKYSTSKMKQPLQSRRQTKLQKGEGRENPVKGERERKRERK